MVIQDMGHPIAEIPITEGLVSLYTLPIIIPQSETERLLSAHLQKQGVEVERNIECVDLRHRMPMESSATCDGLTAPLKPSR